MTNLTLNQLQRMYSANIFELKSASQRQAAAANPPATSSESQEIIPDENNPLFMSAEQRAASFSGIQILPESYSNVSRPSSATDVDTDPNNWDTPATAKFIDEMKDKYIAVRNQVTIGTLYRSFNEIKQGFVKPTLSPSDIDNAFVWKMGQQFERVISAERTIQSVQEAKDRTEQGEDGSSNPMKQSNLANCQADIDGKRIELNKIFNGIKGLAEKHGTQAETSAFFADYTGFVTGTRQSLEAAYREYGIT